MMAREGASVVISDIDPAPAEEAVKAINDQVDYVTGHVLRVDGGIDM